MEVKEQKRRRHPSSWFSHLGRLSEIDMSVFDAKSYTLVYRQIVVTMA